MLAFTQRIGAFGPGAAALPAQCAAHYEISHAKIRPAAMLGFTQRIGALGPGAAMQPA